LKELQQQSGISTDELQWFLEYAAQFLGNCGNYKSFGDSKFIPRAQPEVIEALAATSQRLSNFGEDEGRWWYIRYERCRPHALWVSWSYVDVLSQFAKHYESRDHFCRRILDKRRLLPENTRLRKTEKGDFEVLIASALKAPPPEACDVGEITQGA
jgi:dipeptidyl-peptidase-3